MKGDAQILKQAGLVLTAAHLDRAAESYGFRRCAKCQRAAIRLRDGKYGKYGKLVCSSCTYWEDKAAKAVEAARQAARQAEWEAGRSAREAAEKAERVERERAYKEAMLRIWSDDEEDWRIAKANAGLR